MTRDAFLKIGEIDVAPKVFLSSVGRIFAEFGEGSQDSGNVSYGVQIGNERVFVKTAGLRDNPLPALPFEGRVDLLRNAVRLSSQFKHELLPPLLGVIESPEGPMLAYPWSEGELLGVSRRERDHPESPFQRFRSLPSETIRKCLGQLFDLHAQLIRAGWIAVDFYDGCLLFDFVGEVLHVIDLDMYRQGAFHNEMGRMFGSSRFMAPEEFELGSAIDELTTVFTMGRTALEFLSDGSLDRNAFRGPEGLYDVAARACEPNRDLRLASMSAFYEGWIRG